MRRFLNEVTGAESQQDEQNRGKKKEGAQPERSGQIPAGNGAEGVSQEEAIAGDAQDTPTALFRGIETGEGIESGENTPGEQPVKKTEKDELIHPVDESLGDTGNSCADQGNGQNFFIAPAVSSSSPVRSGEKTGDPRDGKNTSGNRR